MASVKKIETLGSFGKHAAENLSLWELFLFFMWSLCLFLKLLAEKVGAWAGDSFELSLRHEESKGSEVDDETRSEVTSSAELETAKVWYSFCRRMMFRF
jgi:hypothetical protein